MGKTTGTAARYILPAQNEDREIVRRPEGPNIKEQMRAIAFAAKQRADVLVCECMAVNPRYQEVHQEQIFLANMTVLVNVLADHLDDMGPTTDEVAKALATTIPRGGHLIVAEDYYTYYFKRLAERQGTRVFVADSSAVPDGYVDRFDFVMFPESVALGLAVAEALDIDRDTALRGMLKTIPDPGALRISPLSGSGWNQSFFVNAFAANEPATSLKIWHMLREMDHLPQENPIVVFNGRPDRIDRTRQFIADFFPNIEADKLTLLAIGQNIRPLRNAMKKGAFPGISDYVHLENAPLDRVVNKLLSIADNSVIVGLGNIHGDAEDLVDVLNTYCQKTMSEAAA